MITKSPEDEFLDMIQTNASIIHKVVRLYIDDPEDRKDLLQEIIGQAWKSFSSFRGEAKFSTWLYRISANTVLTYKRKQQPVPHPLDNKLHDHIAASDEVENAQAELLLAAIKRLPETDRLLVSLHLDGYSNEEVADVVGLDKPHVAVKLHRIKQQLIKMLKPHANANESVKASTKA
ncbi:sigma-70 family RNA polymerase sigma factor [uncultured Pontibacter sp.]|uniref:RNA polymerase sigma factor n=1 Tax=uncultured Pontibacter sp. TaxID=453356 RepID=UPI0026379D4A|nr:sigma-70 family RNA polymerase sigma factor [uncultured Pontibacter sp.]